MNLSHLKKQIGAATYYSPVKRIVGGMDSNLTQQIDERSSEFIDEKSDDNVFSRFNKITKSMIRHEYKAKENKIDPIHASNVRLLDDAIERLTTESPIQDLMGQNVVIYGGFIIYMLLSSTLEEAMSEIDRNKSDIDLFLGGNYVPTVLSTPIKQAPSNSAYWCCTAHEKLLIQKMNEIQKICFSLVEPSDFSHLIEFTNSFYTDMKDFTLNIETYKSIVRMSDIIIPCEIHLSANCRNMHEMHPAYILKDHLSPIFSATSLMYIPGVGLQTRIDLDINTIISHIKQKKLVLVNKRCVEIGTTNKDLFVCRALKYMMRGWTLEIPKDEALSTKIIQILGWEYENTISYLYRQMKRSKINITTKILDDVFSGIIDNTWIAEKRFNTVWTNSMLVLRSFVKNVVRRSLENTILPSDISDIIADYSTRYCENVIYPEYIISQTELWRKAVFDRMQYFLNSQDTITNAELNSITRMTEPTIYNFWQALSHTKTPALFKLVT